MLLKLLLKIWPSLIPITAYLFWVLVIENIVLRAIFRKKTTIDGEKIVGEKTTEKEEIVQKISKFSLQNRYFVVVLYLSLILAIVTLISSAFI